MNLLRCSFCNQFYNDPGGLPSYYQCTRCGNRSLVRVPGRPIGDNRSNDPAIGGIAGAVVGGLAFGPIGLVVGGVLGLIAGEQRRKAGRL